MQRPWGCSCLLSTGHGQRGENREDGRQEAPEALREEVYHRRNFDFCCEWWERPWRDVS